MEHYMADYMFLHAFPKEESYLLSSQGFRDYFKAAT